MSRQRLTQSKNPKFLANSKPKLVIGVLEKGVYFLAVYKPKRKPALGLRRRTRIPESLLPQRSRAATELTTVPGAAMRQARKMKIAFVGVNFFVLNDAFGYFQSRGHREIVSRKAIMLFSVFPTASAVNAFRLGGL